MTAANEVVEVRCAKLDVVATEANATVKGLREEIDQLLHRCQVTDDEMAERSQEIKDIRESNERLNAANEALREELVLINDDKKVLERTRESLKDAIEDMQSSARSGTDAVDLVLGHLGGECERAKVRLGQLRASFDGRSVIDDVICLQHVTKLLASELERAVVAGRDAQASLRDWRVRHATVTKDHDSLNMKHSDLMVTREQLLQVRSIKVLPFSYLICTDSPDQKGLILIASFLNVSI